ncbi:Protein-N(Pi)-phosphohistidine--sugar phosphotransferase [Lactobacillus equicursoris 66c]|uniref:PTS system sucrose-specific EIIBCA component n=1 Tax=Lactobacillus equicursoris 66c TaxID=872326 RepID=K0NMS9_9LACO|nr:beta-glucoside-specific PTS transporter subunit IIABC [Lactobacillus equicursoris]CCK82969.1 Protein-N(Pi)-phosphohistidine--sugar phosphotransferase [Lactobacillus equicursoris 66c]
MDYKQVAKDVITNVGGKGNVQELNHCYTRLRFKLRDVGKANKDALEQIDGVMSVVYSGGEYQVIIGTEVAGVYDSIINQGLISAENAGNVSAEAVAEPTKKNFKYYVDLVLDVITACFTPIIPVIAGSGMIKVLNAILISCHVLTQTSQTYIVLNAMGDALYYFLPIFVAATAAKRLKADMFTSMTVAAIMLYPKLTELASKGTGTVSFIGIPMKLLDYSSQALPIVLVVLLVKYVDLLSDKITPNLVKTFLRPMITILISAPVALLVLGPVTQWLSAGFTSFTLAMNKWGWIAVGLNAALFPFLVLTGTHNALIPLMIQMFATQGFDPVLVPSGLAANIAEGGAAAAVAVKTKNAKMKSTAFGATISALFGVTEPALYGVNLRLRRPFVSMIIGSFLGGAVSGLLHLTAYAFVSPSILSLPIFIGKNSNLLTAAISAVASFALTFLVTYLIGFKDVDSEEKTATASNTTATLNTAAVNVNMIVPAEGQLESLEELNDGVFSKGLLGKGFAVKPENDQIVSPVDAEVMTVFPTKHAIGLKTQNGLEVMVHMGIDTVNLKGDGFTSEIKVGDHVTAGQPIAEMDLKKIKNAGYKTDVIVVVTNTAKYASVTVTPAHDGREVGFAIEK